MSFENTAREILESLRRCVKEQNKVFHQSDFVRCEAVRAGTSFGGSADQQEPFVDWLLALEGRGMVQVKRMDEACMVALGPEGRAFLLTEPKDETKARSRRQVAETSPGLSPGAFVCHGSQDREFVEKLSADLRSYGVDVWYSEWEIRPGDSIRQKIDDGLQRCEFFIIVLSKRSIGRPWVHTELDAATIRKLEGKVRKIIPIKIDDCGDLPATLNSLRWEDFCSGSYDSSLGRVLDSIFERDVRPPLGKPPVGSISVDRAIQLLEGQIAEPIDNVRHDDPKAYEWEHITHRILTEAFGEHHRNANHFITTVSYSGLTDEENQEQHVRWVRDKKNMLRTFVRELQMFPEFSGYLCIRPDASAPPIR
jgi:TIR domain